jgi:hypothetical protein
MTRDPWVRVFFPTERFCRNVCFIIGSGTLVEEKVALEIQNDLF